MPLSDIQAVISDMDGVLWRGMEPLPALADLFAFLCEHELPFMLATNNSGRHPDEYVKKLAGMGVDNIVPQQIVTAGTATADYLRQQYPDGAALYVIGHDGLRRVLTEAGFTLRDDDVQAVVVGIDFDFDYDKARHAALLIRNTGAAFVGTNPDVTFPSPAGLVPGAGSLIAMIAAAVDTPPTIIGKPQPAMFEIAAARLGIDPAQILMIGDRLNTDIEGAHAVGMQTALVLTGVSSREDITDIMPDYIYDGLPELIAAWREA